MYTGKQPLSLTSEFLRWCTDDSNQRFGQYFLNKYFKNIGPEFDKLYNEENYHRCFDMLTEIYIQYNWEL